MVVLLDNNFLLNTGGYSALFAQVQILPQQQPEYFAVGPLTPPPPPNSKNKTTKTLDQS